MNFTKRYRDQHDDLQNLVNEISSRLNVDTVSNNTKEVRTLLARLFGKNSVHLAMEDKSLYPRLLDHADEHVRSLAKKFIIEMGEIGEVINSYKDQWTASSEIKNNPDAYIDHTKRILNALSIRMERENNELYKVVDDLYSN